MSLAHNSHVMRRLIEEYGRPQGRVTFVNGNRRHDTRAFERAGGMAILEMVLARAGLLENDSTWQIRLIKAAPMPPVGAPIVIREATTSSVHFKMQPTNTMSAIDASLLVDRQHGTPDEVRRRLFNAVADLESMETLAPPTGFNVEEELQRLLEDPDELRPVLEAIQQVVTDPKATNTHSFVTAFCLEMGSGQNQPKWATILSGLAKKGILRERKYDGVPAGYVTTPAGEAMVVTEKAIPKSGIDSQIGGEATDEEDFYTVEELNAMNLQPEPEPEPRKGSAPVPQIQSPIAIAAPVTQSQAAPAKSQTPPPGPIAGPPAFDTFQALAEAAAILKDLSGARKEQSDWQQQLNEIQQQQDELLKQREMVENYIKASIEHEKSIVAKLPATDIQSLIASLQMLQSSVQATPPSAAGRSI